MGEGGGEGGCALSDIVPFREPVRHGRFTLPLFRESFSAIAPDDSKCRG